MALVLAPAGTLSGTVTDADLGTPAMSNVVDGSAAQLIIDVARRYPGELTWIGLGPITNLALALLLEPALPTLNALPADATAASR